MDEILIKKYDNRRLYCVDEAKYVSLGDIRKMLVDGKNIKVVEKNSGKDITKYVMMQIVLEERYEMFPDFFLKMMIAAPPNMLEQFFKGFFPQMMEYFLKMRENQMFGMPFNNMMFPQPQQQFPFMPNMGSVNPNFANPMDEIIKRLADLEKKFK
ncbi:MAG TPA: polyhydroxyalkanoate synthesis regulator DNA-binding domain-containing protein [Candidatus Wallbacteria bacterium]|nr:polyhydroxyalkanoate synthesis regulator DNA-binding domain-containing protein [Candidatus Wallbacteria bacterium]